MSKRKISIAQARRIALCAQGFCDRAPKGKITPRHFRRALHRMQVLQLDSVNVLCRSHFLPMLARLGPYSRDSLDDWLWRSGENLEYLAHEASFTQMELFPLLRHRMTLERWKSGSRFLKEEQEYLNSIKKEITDKGPRSVKDLAHTEEKTKTWWGWSRRKLGLQVLYRSGQLAVSERSKTFLTLYDLSHRVVPDALYSAEPIEAALAQRKLLLLAAQSHGIGTEKDLADYFRLKIRDCRPLLHSLVDEGQLEEVQVEGWNEPTYFAVGAKQARQVKAHTFLSPFDPVVWFRPRCERLFAFKYRIEIYVPEAKRKHGYYVLPFLLEDKLVGRVDLKADRQAGKLLAKAAFIEEGNSPDVVADAMAQSLKEMVDWLGLQNVKVGRKGNLAKPLKTAIS